MREPKPENQWKDKIKGTATGFGKNFKRKKITHLHKLFRNKGTGFYGIGYVITLVFLEVKSFIEEVADFTFAVDNLVGALISHIINFSIETLINIVKASIWPFILISELPNSYGVPILIGSFFIYYLADKKWNFQQIYKEQFSVEQVQTVIDLWHQQQTDNLAELNHLIFSNETEIDFYQTLSTQAELQQLEHWRHHPDSSFALVLLLNSDLANKSEQVQKYCFDIIESSIAHKLDKELDCEQRCYLYLPLAISDDPKHQKLSSKSYSRLCKKLSQSQRIQINTLISEK